MKKYLVILCDGMADWPVKELGNKTPMQVADIPNIRKLAQKSTVGMVKTVPEGYPAGSDVANLSVMGYDPVKYYSGRSPLEAVAMDIKLEDTDQIFRMNLVTVDDKPNYEEKTMVDYCAGDIETDEARILVNDLKKEFGTDILNFYAGFSYRHCLVVKNGDADGIDLVPPHDFTGKVIGNRMPSGDNAKIFYDLIVNTHEFLNNHPINKERVSRGLLPANSIWFWGQGTTPKLDNFKEKTGLKGAVVTAVDLIKGIGKLADMKVYDIPTATATIETDFESKVAAAVDAFKTQEFVYLHIEAPDECGHRKEIENKVKSLEYIDKRVVEPMLEALKDNDIKVMILPDHPTPLEIRTHTNEPVPFMIYDSESIKENNLAFDENLSETSDIFVSDGYKLIDIFIND